jgi:hypothetical protein
MKSEDAQKRAAKSSSISFNIAVTVSPDAKALGSIRSRMYAVCACTRDTFSNFFSAFLKPVKFRI